MLSAPSETMHRARTLRRSMTLPEGLLWGALRQRPDGFKFRRQHPAGFYVLDFFCAAASLAIEIDGTAHDRGDQPVFDAARDAQLTLHGIATLRIPARQVLTDLDGAIATILAAARVRLPLHHLPEEANGPLPVPGRNTDD